VAPWWCDGRRPCRAGCDAAVAFTHSATVVGGGCFTLAVPVAVGAGVGHVRRLRLALAAGVLTGLARRWEVGTTTVTRAFRGSWWCATMATSPRRLRLQGDVGFIALGESPCRNLSGGLAAAPSGVALPVEGAMLE
jgi:hypothetical protein